MRNAVIVMTMLIAGLIDTGCMAGGDVLTPGTNAQENPPAQTEESKLPPEMPEAVEMQYGKNDGQVRYSTHITVKGDQLIYNETMGPHTVPIDWSRNISAADREELYKAFVENKFDLIRNDPGNLANDTPGETISISPNGDPRSSTSVTWDPVVLPLSGVSQARFEAIRQVFLDLAEKYKPKRRGRR